MSNEAAIAPTMGMEQGARRGLAIILSSPSTASRINPIARKLVAI